MYANRRLAAQLAPGIAAFLLAVLSVADMFLPRPYDGVILDADSLNPLEVRQVVANLGADIAGIRPGDTIVGIDREILKSTVHAQELLNRHSIGETVPYLIRSSGHTVEVGVKLARRHIADLSYLFAVLLGFTFFVVGTFVVVRQPNLPASRAFSTMCSLFMLFLVCRLRPASYSAVDLVVLTTGTMALLFLPAAFLHFFVIFPRPIWEWRRDPIADVLGFIARRSRVMLPLYLVPPLVYAATVGWARLQDTAAPLISGAPAANWWVMVGYMLLGLGALGLSARYLPDSRQRRGAGLVFAGTLFGVVPFIVLAVAFPSFLNTERFLYYGVAPLILVPITFAYAIIRFGLMDIRVMMRKSLLYTITTALVTALYALGIASFNTLFRDTALADSPYFPVIFALTIVVLFEPLRQRIQGPVNRFFFAERLRLQTALVDMGEAFTSEVEIDPVVRELVERLPSLLGLHFAALYLVRDDRLVREAGPEALPADLKRIDVLERHLQRNGFLVRLDDLAPLRLLSSKVDGFAQQLGTSGVNLVGLMASSRRTIGVVLLSAKTGNTAFEREEMQLLRRLMHQASIALETSILLEERTRQAEIEKELKIAATIQASLLPERLQPAEGWQIAAMCRPAREVGGDFYTELPGHLPGERAVAYGDVSGKSIPGALMMMAAHEVLNTLALAHPEPSDLMRLANERLYTLRNRATDLRVGGFVALGYLAFTPSSGHLRYTLAGQPPPMVRRNSGRVTCMDLPTHRVPLGALSFGGHEILELEVGPDDLILAYSDGVIEAQSSNDEMFGEERLIELLANCSSDPQQAIQEVLDELIAFTRGRAFYDDVTLVAARWRG